MNCNSKKFVSKGGMLWFDVELRSLATREGIHADVHRRAVFYAHFFLMPSREIFIPLPEIEEL